MSSVPDPRVPAREPLSAEAFPAVGHHVDEADEERKMPRALRQPSQLEPTADFFSVGLSPAAGQAPRDVIRQLLFFDGALLVLAGRGLLVLDARTHALIDVLLPELEIDALVPCGAQLCARVGTQLRPLDLGEGRLAAALALLPERVQDLAACATHLVWPSYDGIVIAQLGATTPVELRTPPRLLGEGLFRQTPNRVALSPAGRFVAAYRHGGAASIWARESGELLEQIVEPCEAIVLFDDGVAVVSGNDRHRLHRLGAGTPAARVSHPGEVLAAGEGVMLWDRHGGHAALSLEPFALTSLRRVHPRKGAPAPARSCAAACSEGVAIYAGASGSLHVSREATRVSWGWSTQGLTPGMPGLAVEVTTTLPTTQPFAAPGLPVLLELGGRQLVALQGAEGLYLCDESGERVKSLRKTKHDDPRAFARAKLRWQELRARGTTDFDLDAAWLFLLERALLTGQSATVAELQAAWATPAGARNLEDTVWVELERNAPLAWEEGLVRSAGAPLPETARVRLAHPARWPTSEAPLRGLQAMRATHRPTQGSARELVPGAARMRPVTLGRILLTLGFEAVGDPDGERAWHLIAPELGGVAVVCCDAKTRRPRLSFRAWNGTAEGGELSTLAEVDAQLYAEAYEALLTALPSE